ncbi:MULTISPECIES: GldL-related protein [Hymenobacter]|uniref:Gliding motility protein GldL-like N-terminal domain-containing protein n=2 Tax=Hymenobacter TaxID=89966 RepID=A0ABS6X4W8_9BACT|nr:MULTISPECIES: hypothetical protein [Hymenobacter]MBO3271939.1 hypothetical protein [Hymenobacter defluvii]MBW3130893.1 hypothetical protein [Hymenobacter profundi]QNE40202.1 hypothetical protein F1C16_11840 [Hymenobacter sp. NBH84]
MEQLPSYPRLFSFFAVGIALVLLGALLKTQHAQAASWLILAGLSVQAVAGMLLVYRFAKSRQPEE